VAGGYSGETDCEIGRSGHRSCLLDEDTRLTWAMRHSIFGRPLKALRSLAEGNLHVDSGRL
jgi:hypothetical protein